ncbi:hypothetical protein Cgig2_010756 [Carnegiea gigantea]|uniref:HD domain-containing protein n=1 Tax=Carnegiea gigantea TaxID=171969 RepID=A0A9Q1KMB7_9CARY|nr:hypothetical protein Cgig2_010756 [Carnegiea gigantea]
MSATANPSLSPACSSPLHLRRFVSSSFSISSPTRLSFVSVCCQSRNPAGQVSTMADHASLSSPSPSSAIDFLTLCRRLKTTKRKGWINHGLKGPESIADHMYRMALMGLIADDIPGVNRERCIKIAIVHDIAEAIVGDITPSDGIPKEEKSRREQAALNEMCEILGGGMRGMHFHSLPIFLMYHSACTDSS